jgi:hypothetical protein
MRDAGGALAGTTWDAGQTRNITGELIYGKNQATGRLLQVEPMKPVLTMPGTKRLKLKYDKRLSILAFNQILRRYT